LAAGRCVYPPTWPDVNSTGVILQGAVIVTFDQEIDVTRFSEFSFLLSALPETPNVPSTGLVGKIAPVTGTDNVQGTFTFALNSAGATVTKQSNYTYNQDGTLNTLQDFGGTTFTYSYDSVGRQTGARDGSGNAYAGRKHYDALLAGGHGRGGR
jgi:hypothetical protein